jgi:hypothetical protein
MEAAMGRRLLAVAVFIVVVAPSVAGQSRQWVQPRTPDGQPDLQGFWTNATFTPLERPKGVTKEFYTKQEAAEVEKRLAAEDAAQTEPGTIADVHYDFTQFGLDTAQAPYASNLRTSLIVDPLDGKLPPLSAEGQKRAAERAEQAKRVGRWDSAQSNDLDDRCMIFAGAGPPMLPQSYNSNYQILQAPGYVMILFEMAHDVRIVPLDGRAHVSPDVRQWVGDSRGRWEGNTLVIETTNFNGKNPIQGSSANMKVVERFTRVDSDTLVYKFTVEDSSTWTRPWSAEIPMRKTTGPLFEHACHEGNHGLYNTLAGKRLEEKKAAEEAAKKSSN